MIITSEIENATKYAIHDCTGQVIPFVTYYNTDTCEIEMAICLTEKAYVEDSKTLVESPQELQQVLSENAPKLLKQIAINEAGEAQPGYVFVRFPLPGSYATFEGQKIQNQAH